jgi:hypothetical protein
MLRLTPASPPLICILIRHDSPGGDDSGRELQEVNRTIIQKSKEKWKVSKLGNFLEYVI